MNLSRLQAPTPTAPEERCACVAEPPVVLMSALSPNPVHCLACNLEVALARLRWTPALIDAVADWRSVWDALDRLWLSSGPYAEFAAAELQRLSSPVNTAGLAAARGLSAIHPTYYHLFVAPGGGPMMPGTSCPGCGHPLRSLPGSNPARIGCDECRLAAYQNDAGSC